MLNAHKLRNTKIKINIGMNINLQGHWNSIGVVTRLTSNGVVAMVVPLRMYEQSNKEYSTLISSECLFKSEKWRR